MPETNLESALRDVADGADRIARLKQLIARLEASGRDKLAQEARVQLAWMEDQQRVLEERAARAAKR